MFRRFAHAFGLLAGLAPALVHAQTNIDQGKSPADIFANDCATCHKSARGLANGRSSSTLAGFLVEHYTASRDQAAALAAYVMGAGGGEAAPVTQGRGSKPASGQAKGEESRSGAQPARQTEKPEEGKPATARLQPPTDETKRSGDVPSIVQEPGGRKPVAGRQPVPPATAARDRRKGLEAAPPVQAPAATVAEPSTIGQDGSPATTPGATGPANADSGDSAPVPRDNVPD